MQGTLKSISLNLPFGLGGATIEIGQAERVASWQLYVEFNTRIATQAVAEGAGSVRETLTSLYNLFGITREILKEAGPDIGQSEESLGPITMRVLNDGLRPFLTHWHAAYGDHEVKASLAMLKEHGLKHPPIDFVDQAGWAELQTFHEELEKTRKNLRQYVGELAKIAGSVGQRN